MIKVPGALDDGEIDSLQHIALFSGEKLVTVSSDWLQISMEDQHLINLQLSLTSEESKVYLTATGVINEAGVTMANTVGRHDYRLIKIELDERFSIVVLCSDAWIIEEFSAQVNFLFQSKNYLELPPEVQLPNIDEWMYASDLMRREKIENDTLRQMLSRKLFESPIMDDELMLSQLMSGDLMMKE